MDWFAVAVAEVNAIVAVGFTLMLPCTGTDGQPPLVLI